MTQTAGNTNQEESRFDPKHVAQVVGGPAQRPLPRLPLVIAGDGLQVAGRSLVEWEGSSPERAEAAPAVWRGLHIGERSYSATESYRLQGKASESANVTAVAALRFRCC
jgi:hypothetical protein